MMAANRRETQTPSVARAYSSEAYTFRKYWTGAEIEISVAPVAKTAIIEGNIGMQQSAFGTVPRRIDARLPFDAALCGTKRKGAEVLR